MNHAELTADKRGHHRRVHHPETLDTQHPALRVAHGGGVRLAAHARGARRVVRGVGAGAHERVDLRVALDIHPWLDLCPSKPIERLKNHKQNLQDWICFQGF